MNPLFGQLSIRQRKGPLDEGKVSSFPRNVGALVLLVSIGLFPQVTSASLLVGDADQDCDYDQYDWVKVFQAGKYLTGEPATWGDGDWDGAPGGRPGAPPAGNGLFDQLDIIAALSTGTYLTGPYNGGSCGAGIAPVTPKPIVPGGAAGDGQTSIVYDAKTGEVGVDAPAGQELTSISIESASSIFTGDPGINLHGNVDIDADDRIFKAALAPLAPVSFGSITFGHVAQTELSQAFLLNDLKVAGSLAGGGPLGNVDLVHRVCEFFRQDLRAADFSGQDLTGQCFAGANLEEADFRRANLNKASFVDAKLTGARLTGVLVQGTAFRSATLNRADLSGSSLRRADFDRASLTDASLNHADLTEANFNQATLTDADLSEAGFVHASFRGATLTGADLGDANLRGAEFMGTTLTGANLTGAVVKGAWLGEATSNGFTQEQLYSTASYQAKDLEGIVLSGNDLSGWDFAGQNLSSAGFWSATLTDANLSFADLRGAGVDRLGTATTRNAILHDGAIDGLALTADEVLVVRDHEEAITVGTSMRLAETSTLELRFEDATWGSSIRVASGVPTEIGGTLALHLTAESDTRAMLDATFPVFSWNGRLPPGERFDRIVSQPGVEWGTEQLYTSGIVRLRHVAELMPGDANRDLAFDAQDVVRVLQAGKYLTGEPATWGEGDWNGAPGGWWGNPPAGDGVFNQLDIVAAQQAAAYLTGPYVQSHVDGNTPATMPEPSAFTLALMAAIGYGAFRCRRS